MSYSIVTEEWFLSGFNTEEKVYFNGTKMNNRLLPEVGTSANPKIVDPSFFLRICELNFFPQIFADIR